MTALMSRKAVVCLAALWIAVCGLCQLPACAQPVSRGEVRMEQPSLAEVEATLEALRQNKEPDETTRKVIEAYVRAAEELKRAAVFDADAKKFELETKELPKRLSELQRQLRALSDPPRQEWDAQADLANLEQQLQQREAALDKLKAELAELDSQPAQRDARRKELAALLGTRPARLNETRQQLDALAAADAPPQLKSAWRLELTARLRAIDLEKRAFEAELAYFDAAREANLARLRRDVTVRKIAVASEEQKHLGALVNQRRKAEAAALVAQARQAVDQSHPLLRPYARRNQELAEAAAAVSRKIEATDKDLQATRQMVETLSSKFQQTQEKVRKVGLTGPIGLLLRKERTALPNLREYHRRMATRKEELNDASYALLAYDEERANLLDAGPFAEQILRQAAAANPRQQRALEVAARDIVIQQREYLTTLVRNYDTYVEKLVDLDNYDRDLIQATENFRAFVDERVLWIRSSQPVSLTLVQKDLQSLVMAFHPERASDLLTLAAGDAIENWYLVLPAVLLLCGLYLYQVRWRRKIKEIAQVVAKSNCLRFLPTLHAVAITGLFSLLWPGAMWCLGWRLDAAAGEDRLAKALGIGLMKTAGAFLALEIIRQCCRRQGLADGHFQWPSSCVRLLRRGLRWFIALGLPPLLAVATWRAYDVEHGRDALERLAFCLVMLVAAAFLYRLFHPRRGVLQELFNITHGGWLDRLRYVWWMLAFASPLGLAGLAAAGYYYSATHLAWCLGQTALGGMGLLLARSFFLRWLAVFRRKLLLQQMRRRRSQEADAGTAAPPCEPVDTDLTVLNTQTRRLLNTGFLVASVAALGLVWADVLPALNFLDRWTLWHTSVAVPVAAGPDSSSAADTPAADGEGAAAATERPATRMEVRAITPLSLLSAMLVGALAVIAARNVPGLLEMALLSRLPLEASVRYAIKSLVSYAIGIVGLLATTHLIGVGWSQVQWLAAALTFGLGFGLQEIFANFVSGIIILFERPIRVGDVVTVDGVSGTVSQIRIRATTITDWDRKEYVVPNREFVTGRVLNWTLSDNVNRVVVNVGVAYGTDTDLALKLLVEAAHEVPKVLREPPPSAAFESFGDSTLNLVLRFFLPDLEERLDVISSIHTAIDRKFRAANIEIAYPQRDINIRGGKITVVHERAQPAARSLVGGADKQAA